MKAFFSICLTVFCLVVFPAASWATTQEFSYFNLDIPEGYAFEEDPASTGTVVFVVSPDEKSMLMLVHEQKEGLAFKEVVDLFLTSMEVHTLEYEENGPDSFYYVECSFPESPTDIMWGYFIDYKEYLGLSLFYGDDKQLDSIAESAYVAWAKLDGSAHKHPGANTERTKPVARQTPS